MDEREFRLETAAIWLLCKVYTKAPESNVFLLIFLRKSEWMEKIWTIPNINVPSSAVQAHGHNFTNKTGTYCKQDTSYSQVIT